MAEIQDQVRKFQAATAHLVEARRQEYANSRCPEAVMDESASVLQTIEALPNSAPPLRKCAPLPHWIEELAEVVEAGTVPGLALVTATLLSLTLANNAATSGWWLSLWTAHVGPHIGSHALSVRAWINEGLMAIFFFVVGLEIKQEFRLGSLASVRKALLPCLAAFGGMITPMAIYIVSTPG